jgi:hypothetical protein
MIEATCLTRTVLIDDLAEWVATQKEQGYTVDAANAYLNGDVDMVGCISLADKADDSFGYCMAIAVRREAWQSDTFFYLPSVCDCGPVAAKYGITVF